MVFFFFFQAEDGIRDSSVTGVQTCALPIWRAPGAGLWMACAVHGRGNTWIPDRCCYRVPRRTRTRQGRHPHRHSRACNCGGPHLQSCFFDGYPWHGHDDVRFGRTFCLDANISFPCPRNDVERCQCSVRRVSTRFRIHCNHDRWLAWRPPAANQTQCLLHRLRCRHDLGAALHGARDLSSGPIDVSRDLPRAVFSASQHRSFERSHHQLRSVAHTCHGDFDQCFNHPHPGRFSVASTDRLHLRQDRLIAEGLYPRCDCGGNLSHRAVLRPPFRSADPPGHPRSRCDRSPCLMVTVYWVWGLLVGGAWFYKLVECALGMPKVPDLTSPKFAPDSFEPQPRVSIIVPALNEEEKLEAALGSLLVLDYPNYEIIAVDDRSTDRTGAIMDRLAADDSERLKVVHIRELTQGWLGKPHALQRGSEVATGDWLLFTDADIHFRPDALRLTIGFGENSGADHVVIFPTLIMKS